ncbi:acyl carrier protein [Chromobacterium haemolyticum]|uniref:acyl carrier protein n=1 Tax=Chromobacterium haemolyticum TaxID=394935 RepID=UPI0009D9DF49|nr:acyl carrier protein [Chromobacterium haemolyticum]OQS42243.1 acyl carrier protein [Chromobacterium haemolyticum]
MSHLEKYDQAFMETFMVEQKDLATLKYQDIAAWDSVGHMALMAALEEAFDIEMDIDDIIEFSSYVAGQAILAKYKVVIEPAA